MAISMLKIRRPLGRLIFNMGIAIPGKTIFLIETAPWFPYIQSWMSWWRQISHNAYNICRAFGMALWLTLYVLNHFDEIWWCDFNSLAPGRFELNFSKVIFELILQIGAWVISCEIAIRWMSMELTDDMSILVQGMAWCRQATSHYLNQC